MKKTKEKILRSARKVLIEQGLDFSMRKVAEDACISLGNLQYYYKTKNDLINILLVTNLEIYEQQLDSFLKESTLEGRERLQSVLAHFFKEETIYQSDEVDELFIALTQSGIMSEEIRSSYYSRLYEMILLVFQDFSPESSESDLHMATSLLLPFFETYNFLHPYLGASGEDLAVVLSGTVWEILKN